MNIRFPIEVRNRFQFLTKEYDFHVADEGSGGRSWEESVTYIAGNVKIEIYHELNTHTVGIIFRDLEADDNQTWEFATFQKLVDRELARTFGYSIPKDETEFLELLDMYSNALRSRGEAILRGESSSFEKFREALKTGVGLAQLAANLIACPLLFFQRS